MTKKTTSNLQDLFKTYVAKSGDEEKFRKMHVTKVVDNSDPKYGPTEDQFTGGTTAYDRKKGRHGYNPGEDEGVYSEETTDGVAAGSLPADDHLCASKIFHEEFGEGTPIFSQHAEPDENGYVAWYDVMFEHGIEHGIYVEDVEVLEAMSHGSHTPKKKRK